MNASAALAASGALPVFDFSLFRHDAHFTELEPGQVLYREGDPGDLLYVFVEGEAQISMGGVAIEELGPGSFVGEMAVIDGSPRYATVTAKTHCRLAKIDERRFVFLLDETPGFAITVIRAIAQRLKTCDLRLLATLADKPGG
jgi:CRP-like cAMP-binding protein